MAKKKAAKRTKKGGAVTIFGVFVNGSMVLYAKNPTEVRESYNGGVDFNDEALSEVCDEGAAAVLGNIDAEEGTVVQLTITPKVLGRWELPEPVDNVPKFIKA